MVYTSFMNPVKKCSACSENLLISSFNKDRSKKDGFSSTCKVCNKARAAAWHLANKDEANSKAKQYYQDNKDWFLQETKLRALRIRQMNEARSDTLYSEENLKSPLKCTCCLETYSLGEFWKDLESLSGFCSKCARCSRTEARASYQRNGRIHRQNILVLQQERKRLTQWRKDNPLKRRAQERARDKDLLQATPPWADIEKIDQIYEKAFRMNGNTTGWFQVDHVVPIKGENVRGLHVHWNLTIKPAPENFSKGISLIEEYWLCDDIETHLENVLSDTRLAPEFNTDRDWWYKKIEPYKSSNTRE